MVNTDLYKYRQAWVCDLEKGTEFWDIKDKKWYTVLEVAKSENSNRIKTVTIRTEELNSRKDGLIKKQGLSKVKTREMKR